MVRIEGDGVQRLVERRKGLGCGKASEQVGIMFSHMLCPWKCLWHAKDPKSVILFVVSYVG